MDNTLRETLDTGMSNFRKGVRKILNEPTYVKCSVCGTKTRKDKNIKDSKTVCYKCL